MTHSPGSPALGSGEKGGVAAVEATRLVKRSLVVAGHRTSVSLENAFWRRLRRVAAERGLSVNALAAIVDASRGGANLSSALRVYVLEATSADPGQAAESQ